MSRTLAGSQADEAGVANFARKITSSVSSLTEEQKAKIQEVVDQHYESLESTKTGTLLLY
jgi:hypothetical protein